MGKPLSVLILQDREDEALRIVGALERSGWEVSWDRADTREALVEALERSHFDLIVSDPTSPFGATDAQAPRKDRGSRLDQQLRNVQLLECLGRLSDRFTHDFNNILGVIMGQSHIMLRGMPADDPKRPRLEQILSASEQAADLTRQLQAFRRKRASESRALDLNPLVEALKPVLNQLVERSIKVTHRPGEGLGRIKADPTLIEQMLLNLALNASDAMRNGGQLEIATSNAEVDEDYARVHAGAAPGHYVCLEVSDTGEGMTAEVRARIFEPFFTTREPGQGTGLGLTVVEGIARQNWGFIHIESEPRQGSTFRVFLPRVDVPSDSVESADAPGSKETVLMVDDVESFRELLREFLEASGYRVLTAEGASQAIETAERHRGEIHLLLTDLIMPGMNGRELALRVKKQRPDVQVLYMSGYTEDAIADSDLLDPGALLIAKPFTQAALAKKVREVLGPPRREEG